MNETEELVILGIAGRFLLAKVQSEDRANGTIFHCSDMLDFSQVQTPQGPSFAAIPLAFAGIFGRTKGIVRGPELVIFVSELEESDRAAITALYKQGSQEIRLELQGRRSNIAIAPAGTVPVVKKVALPKNLR